MYNKREEAHEGLPHYTNIQDVGISEGDKLAIRRKYLDHSDQKTYNLWAKQP